MTLQLIDYVCLVYIDHNKRKEFDVEKLAKLAQRHNLEFAQEFNAADKDIRDYSKEIKSKKLCVLPCLKRHGLLVFWMLKNTTPY